MCVCVLCVRINIVRKKVIEIRLVADGWCVKCNKRLDSNYR